MTNEELILAIRAGHDVTENMTLLYNQNLPMIHRIVKKYSGVEAIEDLLQESYFSLVRAVELWDPEREAQFLTFLIVCLKTDLYRYITDCGALIRIPPNQKTLIYKYDRIMNAYRVELGRDATPEELRAFLGVSKDQFEQLKKDRLTTKPRSTNEVIGGDDEDITLEDTLPDKSEPIEDALERIHREQIHGAIERELEALPEREADVIRKRYYEGLTLKETGAAIGVGPERIRQLEAKALRKLRRPAPSRRLIACYSEGGAYSAGLRRAGYVAFKYDHTSAQERAIIRLEEMTGRIWKERAKVLKMGFNAAKYNLYDVTTAE